MQRYIIDTINEAMKMRSEMEFEVLDSISPAFYVITAMMTVLICSAISLFGSLATMPFVNKAKK